MKHVPSDLSREAANALDAANPLRATGDPAALFDLPDGLIYLDGNSLGALPRSVAPHLARVVEHEWGRGLISSWNDASWIDLPARVGARIAPLIGVPADDVFVGDSTTVLLFKTMVAAARLRPERRTVVVEPTTFPTDAYVAAGVADLLELDLRWCDAADPTAALDEDVALLALTQVDFRTGAMFDMAAITAAVHDCGALAQWDLCHSTGAVPVELVAADVDFAVGCTYKYLNGGPGAPAYAYVAARHQAGLHQPITGWMGHAAPFDMVPEHVPADGIRRMASGTPPVLGLAALDAALEVFDGVDLGVLRATSVSLTDFFIRLVDERLGGMFEVVTPRDPARRGSQVSLRHPEAYGVVQALIRRHVVGDFRTPDIARFGFAPLYVTHTDVWEAVDRLVRVMAASEHRDPAYQVRNRVT